GLIRNHRITPESILPVRFRNLNAGVRGIVHSEYSSYHRVFRSSSVRRRAEARITPGASPYVRQRIGLGAVLSFLVTHHSPIRSSRSVNAGIPACLPEHDVAAKKRQTDASVASGFHVGPLGSRPVFVVAHRQEYLMLQKLCAAPVGINSGEVAYVV